MRRCALFLCVAVLFGFGLARDGLDRWISTTGMPDLVRDTGIEVRDRNNQLLRAYTVADGRWRLGVSMDQVDPTYLAMLITYEDKRFYQHSGVDPRAMARAIWQAGTSGHVVSGASTLTMQVARLLEESGTGKWSGKLRQMRLALALERQFSKPEILQLYLQIVPFGGNLEGVRAASLAYFGKEPRRLSEAEAALLVALPQSPEARRPDRHPKRAELARNRVLGRMQTAGLIDHDAHRAALRDPAPRNRRRFPAMAPHLADRALAKHPIIKRHRLTIDRTLQAQLEKLARAQMQGKDQRLSIAMIIADHQSGEILASVGSPAYSSDQGRLGYIDMTRAKRSPGSTLKPLVYALAFDRGLAHPETFIDDQPVQFGRYAPQNFDGAFRGEVRIARALQLSLNIPVVKLLNELGPAHLMDALRKTGAEPVVPGGKAGLAIGLGGLGISLQELVQSYAALANLGQPKVLQWSLSETEASSGTLFSPRAAWQVGNVLAGITPPSGGPKGRVAFKTGTSYGHRDAWAIGFDGQFVAGVWIGRPDGTPVPGAFGGDLAAPVLFEMLQRARPEPVPLPPPPHDTLMLDNAQLPIPLQRFRGRDAAFNRTQDRIALSFPPDGATLQNLDGQINVKLKGGVAPYTILTNGAPSLMRVHTRDVMVPLVDVGFSEIAVIDAKGQSASVTIRVK